MAYLTTSEIYKNTQQAADIIGLKNILDTIDKIQRGYKEDWRFKDFILLANPKKIDPILHDHSEEGMDFSYNVIKFREISNEIQKLFRFEGSIREQNKSFPWEALIKFAELLVDNKETYKELTDTIKLDLPELKINIEYMLKVAKATTPEAYNTAVRVLEEQEKASNNGYEIVLREYYEDLMEEEYEEQSAESELPTASITDEEKEICKIFSKIAFVTDDNCLRGYTNIRKLTEPYLDKTNLQRIIGLIDKISNCDPSSLQGREAIVSVISTIGEISKSISVETKQLDESIPFSQLKKFRDLTHKWDKSKTAIYLKSEIEFNVVLFTEAKSNILSLRKKIESLTGALDKHSFIPTNKALPIPPIFQSIPNEIHKGKATQVKQVFSETSNLFGGKKADFDFKIDLVEKMLIGEIPIPYSFQKKNEETRINLSEIINSFFKEEFEGKNFIAGLNKNKGSRDPKDVRKDVDDAKKLSDKLERLDCSSETIQDYLSIIARALPENKRNDPKIHAKLYCLKLFLENKENPILHFLYESMEEKKDFFLSLVKFKLPILESKLKIITDFFNDDTYKYPLKEVESLRENEDRLDFIKKLEDGLKPLEKNKEKDPNYEVFQLKLLLYSVEKIVERTNSLILKAGDNYLKIKELLNDSEFHHSHLFHLTVIGQCIQNLRSKDKFLNYATHELQSEFEFLRWVRNGLMHDQKIDETKSLLNYCGNDLLEENLKEHGGRAYDSTLYLENLQAEINKVLARIEGDKRTKNDDNDNMLLEPDIFYHPSEEIGSTLITPKMHNQSFLGYSMLQNLTDAYSSGDYERMKLILKALNYNPGANDPDEEEWYASHFYTKKVLNLRESLTLIDLAEYSESIQDLANRHGIEIQFIFGEIVGWKHRSGISSNPHDSGIFVKCLPYQDCQLKLALFKAGLFKLLGYRIQVITQEHFIEYLNSIEEGAIDNALNEAKYNSFINKHNNYTWNKVINAAKLHQAIENKDFNTIVKLLEEDINLDIPFRDYTPIHIVETELSRKDKFYNTWLKIIERLTELECDLNTYDSHGKALIHYAAENNNLPLLKLLISKGVNIDSKDKNGYTALDWSLKYGINQKIYKYLVQNSNDSLLSKLIASIKAKDNNTIYKIIKWIKEDNGKEALNDCSKDGELAFNVVCHTGDFRLIKDLIKEGFNPECLDANGNTSLHALCDPEYIKDNIKSRLKSIKHLIKQYSLSCNQENNYGETPLSLAESMECTRVIGVLNSVTEEQHSDVQVQKSPITGLKRNGDSLQAPQEEISSTFKACKIDNAGSASGYNNVTHDEFVNIDNDSENYYDNPEAMALLQNFCEM
ncbi:MAG: hypothetical protein K0Q51_1532 [Rickettsiaceae bacterium]|jgi:ankyrin repeat protein/uncharacterized protein with HEPN domain|nr:hypothetical protein [Rickettsiaceae bacterium]